MNYITYSLFGSADKYIHGALRNAELAREFYPGWKCVFWVDLDVPPWIPQVLAEAGCIVKGPVKEIRNKMMWRYLGGELPGCDRFIVRDTDSRPTLREVAAVLEWILSGKMLHTMRDHRAHAREINGGMCGFIAGAVPNMRQLIVSHNPEHTYSADQSFLCDVIWSLLKHDCLQHDSVSRDRFPGSVRFPTSRNGSPRFVGEVVEVVGGGLESFRDGDWQQIDENKD